MSVEVLIYAIINCFFFDWNPLILFSPLGFMQLHLGCMIWDRLDISKRKKWVALMCTMNKFWDGLLQIKLFKTWMSKLLMSLLSNINYFSHSKNEKSLVKKVVYVSLWLISTVLQTENVFYVWVSSYWQCCKHIIWIFKFIWRLSGTLFWWYNSYSLDNTWSIFCFKLVKDVIVASYCLWFLLIGTCKCFPNRQFYVLVISDVSAFRLDKW